jgi:hypothetical protein
VKEIKTVLEFEKKIVVMQTIFSNAVLQRTGQRWHNFQDRARNVPPLNNGVRQTQVTNNDTH